MDATKRNPSTYVGRPRGRGGRQRLLSALTEQFIVGGDAELAAKILKKVVVKEFATAQTLMEQGGEDTHLALILAGRVQIELNGRNMATRLPGRSVFEAGKTTIEDLVKATSESDFAIIVTSKNDVTISRRRKATSPRDNVMFELGLFMGALSREWTLALVPKGVDFKVPWPACCDKSVLRFRSE